jgi:ribosomal protein S19E (S16A)
MSEKLTKAQRRVMESVEKWDRASKANLPGDDWRRLDALERRGLVERASFGSYRITPAGRAALENQP